MICSSQLALEEKCTIQYNMDNIFELESGVIMCKLQLALHDPKKALFYFDMYNFSIKVPIKLYPCLYYNL